MNKYYFISKFDSNNISKQDKQTIVVYRNYKSISPDKKILLPIKILFIFLNLLTN